MLRASQTVMRMTQPLLHTDTDRAGYAMGGVLLSWIDLCAGMTGVTLAQATTVTASVDATHFLYLVPFLFLNSSCV